MASINYPIDTVAYINFDILTGMGDSFTINIPFFCQKCGQCCENNEFPEISQLPQIFKFLNKTSRKFFEKYFKDTDKTNKGYINTRIFKNIPCFFYKDNHCIIYPVRPETCRNWYPTGNGNIINSQYDTQESGVICPAFRRQEEMCNKFLVNRQYRIGIRKIIKINKSYMDLFSGKVEKTKRNWKDIFPDYLLPDEIEVIKIQKIFLSFNPSNIEQEIFKYLNPALAYLDEFKILVM